MAAVAGLWERYVNELFYESGVGFVARLTVPSLRLRLAADLPAQGANRRISDIAVHSDFNDRRILTAALSLLRLTPSVALGH